jgi:hypothetical protein
MFCVLGKEFHQSQHLMLVINRTRVSDLHIPMSAAALLVGSFFIFDLTYPTAAGATLECIQRYIRHGLHAILINRIVKICSRLICN